METVLLAVVPLLSVLAGAGLTYWLNVRQRRRSYVDEVYDRAITALAAASASSDYVTDLPRPPHLTDDEYRDLLVTIISDAYKLYVARRAEARAAVARVKPYTLEVGPFLDRWSKVVEEPEELITVLGDARDRRRSPSRAGRASLG